MASCLAFIIQTMNIELLKELHRQATKVHQSDLTPEQKYDFIFSESISRKVFAECRMDYYDPDSSHEEDVQAFMNAFDEKMEELTKLQSILDD